MTDKQNMKLSDLQNNQVVTYRLGRAGRTEVEWSEWKTGPIYLNRREKAHRIYPKDEILTLTPIDDVFAEFGEKDWNENCFVCEDYYMEIKYLVDI